MSPATGSRAQGKTPEIDNITSDVVFQVDACSMNYDCVPVDSASSSITDILTNECSLINRQTVCHYAHQFHLGGRLPTHLCRRRQVPGGVEHGQSAGAGASGGPR